MDLSFLQYQNRNKPVRIILTGGGSGGHTFPLVAIIRALRQEGKSNNIPLDILYVGPNDFTIPYIQKEGVRIKMLTTGKLRRRLSIANLGDFFKTIGGLFQAMYYVYTFMPDLVFSKGGYGSFPVAFWSILFFIPLYIHESDSVPGLVNRLTKIFAKQIFISFKCSQKYFPASKTVLVGNPIRQDLLLPEKQKDDTKKLLKLDPDKKVVTIIGGSQGSQHINSLILDTLPELMPQMELIHQTGTNNFAEIQREAKIVFDNAVKNPDFQKYYHPVAFFQETEKPTIQSLADVLLVSDLIIARAGSGSIFEVAARGRAAILIPLPWAAGGHQAKNAYEYSEAGAAIVVEEGNLKPHIFSNLILDLIKDDKKRNKMEQAALKFARPQAAQQIAHFLIAKEQNPIPDTNPQTN